MTQDQFLKLSRDLQDLSKTIPQEWGKIQNDSTDSKIDMFACSNLVALLVRINHLSSEDQNYFKKRWFIWKCSQVDEYLFCKTPKVKANPNSKDKDWDIEFDDDIRFDLKGTVVPKPLRQNFRVSMERKLIEYYYANQSKGMRHHMQNRLFIVHHSFRKSERSIFLRCHWQLKEYAYREFNKRMTNSRINFLRFESVLCKCIFLIETKDNELVYKI